MILSVIIPVFNVEPFVEKCIRSVELQDIPSTEYEIVVVNDGSTDNSLEVVNRIAVEFDNIRVFSQPNGGLSAARNTGMKHAVGDYYMFLDSDDWIAENCFRKLTEKLQEEKPDALAICAANVFGEKAIRRQSHLEDRPITGVEFLSQDPSPCAPFAIWSSSFYKKNRLEFYEGIFHEDCELTPRAYYLAQKVSLTNDIVYFVFQNPNSITRTPNPKRSKDLIEVVCVHLSEFSKTINPVDKYIFDNKISMYINLSLDFIIKNSAQDIKRFDTILYKHRDLFIHLKESTKLKYRMEAKLFELFPNNYSLIYKILKGKWS